MVPWGLGGPAARVDRPQPVRDWDPAGGGAGLVQLQIQDPGSRILDLGSWILDLPPLRSSVPSVVSSLKYCGSRNSNPNPGIKLPVIQEDGRD